MTSLAEVLDKALEVIHGAGRLLLEHHQRPRKIRHKGRIDLVTEADTALEAFLKDGLAPILPGAEFMAEESAVTLEPGDCCWIIDPVDGTTNFAHGIPLTAISVGLWRHGEMVLGVVHGAASGRMLQCRQRPWSLLQRPAHQGQRRGFPGTGSGRHGVSLCH